MQSTENITFKDEDTLSLINHLINIYIAKYPISGYISKDPTLHLVNVEKHLNKKQLSNLESQIVKIKEEIEQKEKSLLEKR